MTSPDNMRQQILDRRREILKGYVTAALSELPSIEDLRTYAAAWRIGLDAATTYRSSKRINLRFMVQGKVEQVEELLLTASNVNFDYLHFHNQDTGECDQNIPSARQAAAFHMSSGFPFFAYPFKGQAVYFDMKAFHANVMLAFGRNLDYLPDEYLETAPTNTDYPFWHNKDFRNRLHSSAYNGGASYQIINRKRAVKYMNTPNRFSNPSLIRFTQDLSTFIAETMLREAHIVYANEDGYIVPTEYVNEAFSVLNTIGLPYTIKDAGECEIRGWARYRFTPSIFNPKGKTTNPKRWKEAISISPYEPMQKVHHETFWKLIEPAIVAAQPNLLYPDHSPQSLSDMLRNSQSDAISSIEDCAPIG